jgi:hypothetical protein
MYIFAAMLNLRLAARYLLHRITANNRHGLHSPFVYRLVDKVIYDFYAKNAYTALKNAYIKTINDGTFTTPPLKVVQLLYRLVSDFYPAYIFTTPAISPVVAAAFRMAQPDAGIGPFNGVQQVSPVIIYIDAGTQSAMPVLEQVMPFVHPDSMVIIHNIYRHKHGRVNWRSIKAYPQVIVTMDLFWLQLVFFRTGQRKEHFRVKY